jgi:hypothetical protein
MGLIDFLTWRNSSKTRQNTQRTAEVVEQEAKRATAERAKEAAARQREAEIEQKQRLQAAERDRRARSEEWVGHISELKRRYEESGSAPERDGLARRIAADYEERGYVIDAATLRRWLDGDKKAAMFFKRPPPDGPSEISVEERQRNWRIPVDESVRRVPPE